MAVLRDIYYEYLDHECQTTRPGEACELRAKQDRRTIISSAIPFSLAVAFWDPNYREVAEWFIFRICQEYEAGKLHFNPFYCIPDCWYKDGTGRELIEYDRMVEFQKKYQK